jgi:hypothetical protein
MPKRRVTTSWPTPTPSSKRRRTPPGRAPAAEAPVPKAPAPPRCRARCGAVRAACLSARQRIVIEDLPEPGRGFRRSARLKRADRIADEVGPVEMWRPVACLALGLGSRKRCDSTVLSYRGAFGGLPRASFPRDRNRRRWPREADARGGLPVVASERVPAWDVAVRR